MTEKEDEISIYSDITDIDEQFETVTSPKPGTKAEGYSPANPEIAPASLYYIQLVPGEIQVDFEQRNGKYRTFISDNIFRNQRCIGSLTRRMGALKADRPFPGQQRKMHFDLIQEKRLLSSRLLGIDSNLITTVKEVDGATFQVRPTAKMPTPARTYEKTSISLNQETTAGSSGDTHCDLIQVKSVSMKPVTLANRARKILDYGMMPARRNWEREETLKITESTVVWPPKGRKLMSSDQKKLIWEHAAMTLESTSNSLNNINRSDLLVKYNMLALPGTSEDDKHSECRVMNKSRYYSYEYLRLIVNGKSVTEDDRQFVEMLEAASKLRNKSTDSIISQINRYNVKMRLSE